MIKMMARRAPGPPFWVPGGAGPPFWVALGPMWPQSSPQVDFSRILDPFGGSFGVQNLLNLVLIFDMFSAWFFDWF